MKKVSRKILWALLVCCGWGAVAAAVARADEPKTPQTPGKEAIVRKSPAAPRNMEEQTVRTPEEFIKQLPAQDREKLREVSRLLAVNATVNKLKDGYIRKPEKHPSAFFRSIAGIKWRRMLKNSGFAPIFLSDLFTGASLMNGPSGEKCAIVALYNPWWDALLFFRLEAVENGPQWKISSFELQSGEDFRGERVPGLPSIDSVIAQKGRQALVWMRLIKATRARFDAVFSGKKPENCSFRNEFPPTSRLPVQLRAAARMKLHQAMLGNKGVIVEMSSFLLLLRGVKAEKMKAVLKGSDLRTFRYFAALPVGFRRTMTCYGCWTTERQRLYLYISKMNPNIICLLYINVGVRVNFEMFDLNDSEKYLDAIEKVQSGKAVKK